MGQKLEKMGAFLEEHLTWKNILKKIGNKF